MKKNLILNIVLILGFVLLLGTFIFLIILNNLWNEVEGYISYLRGDILDKAKEYESIMFRLTIPEIFIGISIILDLIVIIIIDLPLIKNILAARKATRKNCKSRKQAKIAKLEAELDELKKED